MLRALDHIVHAIADLDAAAEFYRRCGFQVSAGNRHPWGTHNHVVQLPGFFIEVLTVGEPEKLKGEGLAKVFGFANQNAIARGDGFSMLAFESDDIAADVAEFKKNGIGISEALPFTREATLPDGTTMTVGFTLAFARDGLSPHAGFFAIQHRDAKAFYRSELQQHANGTSAVLGAVLVAENPADHRVFLDALTGASTLSNSSGVIAPTPRGDIEVLDTPAFCNRFGVMLEAERAGAAIKGLRLATPDLDVVDRILKTNNISSQRHDRCVVVPPETAFGATLIFEQATKA